MVMNNTGGVNVPTGTSYYDLYNSLLGNVYGPMLNYQSNQAANATNQQRNYWDYLIGQGGLQNQATRNQNDLMLGQGQLQNTAQGNQLDYAARMAAVQGNTTNSLIDAQTRMRIAQIGAEQQSLDRAIQNAQFAAELAWKQGESDRAYQLQQAAQQLEREKFGLQREQQAYDNGMTTAQFLQAQDQFNRQFGLDTARFNSDEANRAFGNQMAGAQFQFNQQQADRQYGLDRTAQGMAQQQMGAQQALDYNRFGLDQQRFALDRDSKRAEMAANPYNAFANAYFVRGQAASPAFAPFGTPGSGWAYGYQDQPEMPMPRITLPGLPKTFSQPNMAPSGSIKPPTYQSPPFPTWLNFGKNPKPPGVA